MKAILNLFICALLILTLSEACKSKKAPSVADSAKEEQVPETTPAPDISAVKPKYPCSTSINYTNDVKPLIDKHCALSCHSASRSMSGIDLSTYEKVKAEAAKPRFLGAIKHEGYYAAMPKKNPKLSDSTINVIECWIANGSLN